jgi:hypothetical protein
MCVGSDRLTGTCTTRGPRLETDHRPMMGCGFVAQRPSAARAREVEAVIGRPTHTTPAAVRPRIWVMGVWGVRLLGTPSTKPCSPEPRRFRPSRSRPKKGPRRDKTLKAAPLFPSFGTGRHVARAPSRPDTSWFISPSSLLHSLAGFLRGMTRCAHTHAARLARLGGTGDDQALAFPLLPGVWVDAFPGTP